MKGNDAVRGSKRQHAQPRLATAFAVVVASAATLAACVATPGSSIPAQSNPAQPTLIVGQTPDAQPSRAPEPRGEPPGPITYPADNMWAFLATTPGLENAATTLEEAVERADAVVVGRFAGLERGGGYGAPGEPLGWYATALIEPKTVVKGPVSLHGGYVRIPFLITIGPEEFPEKEFDDIARSLPNDPALIFVESWRTYFGRFQREIPSWLDPLDRPDFYRTIGGDGAIRIVDGRLEPPPYNDGWPAALRDASLPDVVLRMQSALRAP